jgi:tetratricopeptide (TPR) repeat protein
MRICLTSLAVIGVVLSIGVADASDRPSSEQVSSGLNEARLLGWQVTLVIADKLRAGDQKGYPGIEAWLKDFDKAARGVDLKVAPEHWPPIDVDALSIHNPNFWQAYYEIAPADPGILLLHAGLLLSGGEATRASHVVAVAKQRPGIPKDLQAGLDTLLVACRKAGERSNRLVAEGTELHDKKDYAGAIAKYREALAAWPQNGWAHYELGYTLYFQQLIAAGEKLPAPDSIEVNTGRSPSPAVAAAYAESRKHDPFQLKAYQGADPVAIRGFLALAEKGMPAWQQIARQVDRPAKDAVLEQLAAACQEANNDELALTIRQVLVARRKDFAPVDHPFISTSLRKLAPGKQTEQTLKRLGGSGKLELRQLVAPELPPN